MIGTQRLRVLQQVARHGSLAGAARELAYTQPAVAHQVAELEREVGTPLVVRHGRGVRLTEAGAALAVHADAVLSRLAAAQDEVAALAALRAGEVDLAITFRYPEAPPEQGQGLVVHPLGDDPIDIVVPAGHPHAGRARHALADLAGETWVAGCARCRAHLLAAGERAGFTPDVAFTTDDFVTQQALVAAGPGLGGAAPPPARRPPPPRPPWPRCGTGWWRPPGPRATHPVTRRAERRAPSAAD